MKQQLAYIQLVFVTRLRKPIYLILGMIAVNLLADFVLLEIAERRGNIYSIREAVPVFVVTFFVCYFGILIVGTRNAKGFAQAEATINRLRIPNREVILTEFIASIVLFAMLFEAVSVSVYLADCLNQALASHERINQDVVFAAYQNGFIGSFVPLRSFLPWRNPVFAVCGGITYACISLPRMKRTGIAALGLTALVLIPVVCLLRNDGLLEMLGNLLLIMVIVNFCVVTLLIVVLPGTVKSLSGLFGRRKEEK